MCGLEDSLDTSSSLTVINGTPTSTLNCEEKGQEIVLDRKVSVFIMCKWVGLSLKGGGLRG